HIDCSGELTLLPFVGLRPSTGDLFHSFNNLRRSMAKLKDVYGLRTKYVWVWPNLIHEAASPYIKHHKPKVRDMNMRHITTCLVYLAISKCFEGFLGCFIVRLLLYYFFIENFSMGSSF